MLEERKGQFSEKLLKLVEYLTQPDWEKRKHIISDIFNKSQKTDGNVIFYMFIHPHYQ